MRLFIAINFNDNVKNELLDVQDRLRECSARGIFTSAENLHLTLVFLGEIPAARVPVIRQAIDEAAAAPFPLRVSGAGRFGRDGGDIWWAGIELSDSLSRLHGGLSTELEKRGFEIEKRKFTPHLTLARRVILRGSFDCGDFTVDTEVRRISLMLSERINGKLTYTELYGRDL